MAGHGAGGAWGQGGGWGRQMRMLCVVDGAKGEGRRRRLPTSARGFPSTLGDRYIRTSQMTEGHDKLGVELPFLGSLPGVFYLKQQWREKERGRNYLITNVAFGVNLTSSNTSNHCTFQYTEDRSLLFCVESQAIFS